MPKYPSASEIEALFAATAKGDFEPFWAAVDPNVNWTVMGTHPLAGTYTSLEEFKNATIKRLSAIMDGPVVLKPRHIIGGGTEWCTAELFADSVCKDGYKFSNTYAWCMRWGSERKIVEVRAYLDSEMVKTALERNET